MSSSRLVFVDVSEQVWRVGFKPNPWAWSGWQWASAGGRFPGRWDDSQGNFRTVYAGSTLLACLLEVLAGFRPDPSLLAEIDQVDENSEDAGLHPSIQAGHVPYSWLEPRLATTATLFGSFCAVAAAESIAALRPRFVPLAHRLFLRDFDTAALRDGRPRELTQAIATYLHAATDIRGITFGSRHGDDLALWAIFERAGDSAVSPALSSIQHHDLSPEHPDVVRAFGLHGLTWGTS